MAIAEKDVSASEVDFPNPPGDVLVAAFLQSMRRLAATVCIVTTREGDVPFGMTATAICSLTTEPPALLVCINREASIHRPVHRARRFCVNLLTMGQSDLCAAFSGKMQGAERFTVGNWNTENSCPPFLKEAQANIFCKLDGSFNYGSHTIIIGKIETIYNRQHTDPLLYLNGEFGSFRTIERRG